MDKSTRLSEVALRIAEDKELDIAKSATHAVPGEGDPYSKLMFVGEAPGAEEDRLGRPFVGAAGRFLEEMLSLIGLKREEVYITNVVKYRPPSNRDPLPEEVEHCWPYLAEQIEIIEPLLIIPLGRHALERFLPGLRISAVHGQPKKRGERVYYPLYHPAAALYNASMRGTLVEDFERIPKVLEKINLKKDERVPTPNFQEKLF